MTDDPLSPDALWHARPLSRRACLLTLSAVAAGALIACTANQQNTQNQANQAQPTPTPDPAVTQFIALSSALTGFDRGELSPDLARTYLQNLANGLNGAAPLGDLYQKAGITAGGPAKSLQDLQAAGLFGDPALQKTADRIIQYWYTGVVETGRGNPSGGGNVAQTGLRNETATFFDSLAWKSMVYTLPPSECKAPGSWAAKPSNTAGG